jgi:glutaryl-CoA dehydrogenase
MDLANDYLALDGLFSADELALRDRVRAFVDERIKPNIAGWYATATFPRELVKEMGALGLLGMHLEGHGCAGRSAVEYGLAAMELEAGDSGIRTFVSVQGSLAMSAIATFGSDEQKERWLPGMAAGELIGCFGLTEPDHGSDPATMATRARRDGADWVLTGGKMWITNAPVADVAVIWARTEEGVSGFAVPTSTPGFTAREVTRKLSLRASSTGEITLDDVRVSDAARLPEARGLKAPLSCLTEARFGIVFGALGAARDCLETAIAYATTREQFGRPIAGFQLTQAKLADMAVELQKGFLLALHLGRRRDGVGELRPEQVSIGKLNNVREAIAIARQCRTILGANGISGEYPIMRHANNLESVLTYEGTSEIHQLVIGQKLTGLNAFAG